MLRSAIIVMFFSVFALACGLYVGEDKDSLDKGRRPCSDPDAGPGGPIPDAGTWDQDGGWGLPDGGPSDAGWGYPDAGS